jgi:hypothetical protein
VCDGDRRQAHGFTTHVEGCNMRLDSLIAGSHPCAMRSTPDLPLCAGTLLPAGSQLGVIDTTTSSLTRLNTGYSSYGKLAVLQSSDGLTVVTVAGSPSKAQALVKLQVTQLERPVAAQCRCDSTRHWLMQFFLVVW